MVCTMLGRDFGLGSFGMVWSLYHVRGVLIQWDGGEEFVPC